MEEYSSTVRPSTSLQYLTDGRESPRAKYRYLPSWLNIYFNVYEASPSESYLGGSLPKKNGNSWIQAPLAVVLVDIASGGWAKHACSGCINCCCVDRVEVR